MLASSSKQQQQTEAAGKQPQQACAEKRAYETNQAEEFVTDSEHHDDDDDAFATDSEDEDDHAMSSMEYILTYKELPPSDVERILRHPVKRTPFADSYSFKSLMAANPTPTQEEIDVMARFHDYVRGEYESKGYVAVGDEYIARRARAEEFSRKLWEGFSVSDDSGEE